MRAVDWGTASMSVYVYAFLERQLADGWELASPVGIDCDYGAAIVPLNIAPPSWGSFNFRHYYEISGERGLPTDMSEVLQAYIATHWQQLNRPSWMSLAEVQRHYDQDTNGRYAHLDAATLMASGGAAADQLRVVFWAD